MRFPPPSNGRPSDRTYHRLVAQRKALGAVAVAAIGAYALLRWKPFRVEIAGSSMRPTLEPGDWAVAVTARTIRRGTIVVVEHPDRPGLEMVKRVVAVPGDPALGGQTLGADELWVEGDAAADSTDSRQLGPVHRERVRGVVRLVYWPPGRRRIVRGRAASEGAATRSVRR
jgi:type IV secretory pathway protease TraF